MSGNGDGKILWGWGQGGLGKVNIGGMGQNDEGADGKISWKKLCIFVFVRTSFFSETRCMFSGYI